MKKFLLIMVVCFMMAGCNHPASNNATATQTDTTKATPASPVFDLTVPPIPDDYKKTSTKKMGLKASIMLSKTGDMQQSELDDNQGTRPEYLVNAFHILTGDTARDREFNGLSATIEIVSTKWSLKQHKDYLHFSSISGFNRWLKETDDCALYTTSPRNTMFQPLRAKDKEVFGFMFLLKSKSSDVTYIVRSDDSFDLTLDEMLRLFAIAKTLEIE